MRRFRTNRNTCVVKKLPTDDPVIPNLAVTPAQMQQMTEHGVAVSAQGVTDFFDGEPNPSWEVPIDRVRGVDIVDCWEEQKTARKHINDHRDANIKKYGDSTVRSGSNS